MPQYAGEVDRWPLVGRSRELSQVAATVVARRGEVITGAAGVGNATTKTARHLAVTAPQHSLRQTEP
jgi:hypothetical protein